MLGVMHCSLTTLSRELNILCPHQFISSLVL